MDDPDITALAEALARDEREEAERQAARERELDEEEGG